MRHAVAALLAASALAVGCTLTPEPRVATAPGEAAPAPVRLNDGARPGPATTGVPPGVTLQQTGSMTITTGGEVVEARDVLGTLTVKADNVTVRRSRITTRGHQYGIVIGAGATGTIIEDVEVNGESGCSAGIVPENFTARRVNIHGCEDGAKSGDNTIIEESWIHDMRVSSVSHNDGIQHSGGSNAVFRGNSFDNVGTNSSIFVKRDYDPIDNVLIDGNWLDGGSYALYVVDAGDVSVRNNRFGRHSDDGPADIEDLIAQSGNLWDDTGRPLVL